MYQSKCADQQMTSLSFSLSPLRLSCFLSPYVNEYFNRGGASRPKELGIPKSPRHERAEAWINRTILEAISLCDLLELGYEGLPPFWPEDILVDLKK